MLHPAGERSGQSPLPAPFPTGGRAPARPSPVPTLQAHGPRRRRERSGVGPSSLAGAHSPRRLPGGGLEPRTPLRPPPRLRASGRLGPSRRGVEAAAARPPGPLRAHSLAARGAALPPAPGPSRSGRRGPFCLQNRSEPVTWVPAPSPPPHPTGEGPAPPPPPQTRAAPGPRRPRLRSRPAPPALLPRLPAAGPRTPRSPRAGRPRSDDGLCRSPIFRVWGLPAPGLSPALATPASAAAPAFRRRLCPHGGTILFPRWMPAFLPGEGRLGGWRLGGSSEPQGCHGSRRSARGPRSGVCAAPSPDDCLTPSRTGRLRPLGCWGRSASPHLGSLRRVCREPLCSVFGETQRKRLGSGDPDDAAPFRSAGFRGRELGEAGGGGGRRPGFGEAWLLTRAV